MTDDTEPWDILDALIDMYELPRYHFAADCPYGCTVVPDHRHTLYGDIVASMAERVRASALDNWLMSNGVFPTAPGVEVTFAVLGGDIWADTGDGTYRRYPIITLRQDPPL